MKYNLSTAAWTLKGFYPWVPLQGKSMETGKELKGITPLLPATVPGGVHFDLYRAGLIPYPYRDMDSLCCEWVENRWWMYRTMIKPPAEIAARYHLVFEGLDYDASVYVDGQMRCRHEGMYDPVRIDVTEAIQAARENDGEVRIAVLFRHAPDEIGQIGYTSDTFTQKSRFNYKWDFGARLVNIGIWGPCYLQTLSQVNLEDAFVDTTVENGKGVLRFTADVSQWETIPEGLYVCCKASGHGAGVEVKAQVKDGQTSAVMYIEQPALWYPNGHGEQPLYDFSATLMDAQGNELDRWERRVGIRSLTYRQNESAPQDSLPYTFVVNGEPIYIKGVNMTPLDHIYGNITPEHYAYMVNLMRQMNVNMVRIWGGGIIEQEVFYDLCDAQGIMVWQEFIQSSSGLDNIPSKKEGFLALLETAATSAVKARRNHVSLTVWSGGNELMDAQGRPATYADSNIAMLKTIVDRLDPNRMFLPTSASGPTEFGSEVPGMSHDIHGDWLYLGNPGHYAFYSKSDSLFHSEFGTEGMAAYELLPRFISPEHYTLESVRENLVYRHHGDWWCTFTRDEAIFGSRKSMREMSLCSQWIQAEGLRFILEANRRRAFANSGSLIWQMNEPWPNVYCTSLVHYSLDPKMAWYWTKNVFERFHVSLQYAKLNYVKGEGFAGTVYLHRDGGMQGEAEVCVQAYTMDGQCFADVTLQPHVQAAHSANVGELAFDIPADAGALFVLRIAARYGEETSTNEYVFGCTEDDVPVYSAALGMPEAVLDQRIIARQTGRYTVEITNKAQVAALHVRPKCHEQFIVYCDNAYFNLLPRESTVITVHYAPRFASGFLPAATAVEEAPVFTFECMNQAAGSDDF